MDLARYKALLSDLEQSPDRVQLFHGELTKLVSDCMDEIYELAKSGESKERKMELVGAEADL